MFCGRTGMTERREPISGGNNVDSATIDQRDVCYDVQWRLPDRTKWRTFRGERAGKQFDARLVTGSASGESLDPRGGKTELETEDLNLILTSIHGSIDGVCVC